jgi:hypothetical protein
MRRLRGAYREVFGPDAQGRFTPAQELVLADLKRFCHAETPCFDPDARIHAFREGRREVWLRKQTFLNLTDRQLADIKEPENDDDD